MRLAALITLHTANNASLICTNSQEELVKLLVLSFSISRYQSSIFEQYIRKASQKKGLTQIQGTREMIADFSHLSKIWDVKYVSEDFQNGLRQPWLNRLAEHRI